MVLLLALSGCLVTDRELQDLIAEAPPTTPIVGLDSVGTFLGDGLDCVQMVDTILHGDRSWILQSSERPQPVPADEDAQISLLSLEEGVPSSRRITLDEWEQARTVAFVREEGPELLVAVSDNRGLAIHPAMLGGSFEPCTSTQIRPRLGVLLSSSETTLVTSWEDDDNNVIVGRANLDCTLDDVGTTLPNFKGGLGGWLASGDSLWVARPGAGLGYADDAGAEADAEVLPFHADEADGTLGTHAAWVVEAETAAFTAPAEGRVVVLAVDDPDAAPLASFWLGDGHEPSAVLVANVVGSDALDLLVGTQTSKARERPRLLVVADYASRAPDTDLLASADLTVPGPLRGTCDSARWLRLAQLPEDLDGDGLDEVVVVSGGTGDTYLLRSGDLDAAWSDSQP